MSSNRILAINQQNSLENTLPEFNAKLENLKVTLNNIGSNLHQHKPSQIREAPCY